MGNRGKLWDVVISTNEKYSTYAQAYSFYGMSIADATKSATEIKTTITRGMIENVYLSNYGRTLADPNTEDFRALQSPEPHQIIPTNGSPMSSVHTLVPAQLAPSTFSLLEYMNTEKEMATGIDPGCFFGVFPILPLRENDATRQFLNLVAKQVLPVTHVFFLSLH